MDLLAQMATLVRVVEAGSLTAAARRLRLSPAAVSRQISALEKRLGAALVLRTTRKLTVTETGRRYAEHAARVLQEIEDGARAASGDRTVKGRMAISAPVTYGLARVFPLLPSLLRKHPELQLDVRLEDRPLDLVREGLDVAIRIGVAPPDSASIVAQPLERYGRVTVASPEYLKRRGTPETPEALARHAALVHVPVDESPAAWRFRRDGREVRVEPRGALRTNVVCALQDAALAGLGIALMPDWLVADDVAAGRLRALLPEWKANEVDVLALHRAEMRGTARIRALLDHLRRAGRADP